MADSASTFSSSSFFASSFGSVLTFLLFHSCRTTIMSCSYTFNQINSSRVLLSSRLSLSSSPEKVCERVVLASSVSSTQLRFLCHCCIRISTLAEQEILKKW